MKKKLINGLIILSTLVFIVSSILLSLKYINVNNINKENELLEATQEKLNFEFETDGSKEILTYREEFNNDEIIAVLEVSDIINTPIVQTTDNKYYLKYSLNKVKLPGGAPFIDYQTSIDAKQINIYGHNSTRYDLPFKKLENYLDESYILEHSVITLKTMNDIRIYQVFAVSIVPKSSKTEHYQFEYSTESEWKEHYNRLIDDSFYESNIELTGEDEIIVLQTCLFGKYRGKLLVVSAKRLN